MRRLATSNQEPGTSGHGTVLIPSYYFLVAVWGKSGGKYNLISGITIGLLKVGVWAVGKVGVCTTSLLVFYKRLSTPQQALFQEAEGSFIPTIHNTYNNYDKVLLFHYYLNTQEA